MIDKLVQLKDYVPLFQTILVIFLILIGFVVFRRSIIGLLSTINIRISHGSSFEAGPIKVGQDLRELKHIDPADENEDIEKTGEGREVERQGIYKTNHGLFLTHVIYPTKKKGYTGDIYIYLIKHKSKDFSEVKSAEFFFGHMWGNRIFKVKNGNGVIGISTSAYAPFLCTCNVELTNGSIIKLHRYIDFEMKRINTPDVDNFVI